VTEARLMSCVVGLVLLAAACAAGADGASSASGDIPPTTVGGMAGDVAAARQRWTAAGLETYHYEAFFDMETAATTEYRCGFGGELVVQVIGGEVSLARDKLGACSIEPSDPGRPPLTIEEWLALIESVVANAGSDVTEVGVRFDEQGVPGEFFMDSPTGFVDGGIRDLTVGLMDDLDVEELLVGLGKARELWEASGVPSYQFQIEVQCFCQEEYRGPFDVLVEDGVVVEALRNGEPAAGFRPSDYFTVAGLFATVDRFAYSDGITVDYHPEFGFPVVIDADPERDTIDDELRIVIHSFEEVAG